MPNLLLMDDTMTSRGTMVGGCQNALESQGFTCFFESGRDASTNAILGSAAQLGKRLYDRVLHDSIEGLVLDIFWGEAADWDGFDIWNSARNHGLAMDKKMVVFLTQHRASANFPKLADEQGFSQQQLLFKNRQGNDGVVKWFSDQFNI